MKNDARILDATSGNRFIWNTKESPHIIFMDIEGELEYQPDIVGDCTNTDFPDNFFNVIFFDPPHQYGKKKNALLFCTPSKAVADEKWPKHKRKYPRYYGWDKYQTRASLVVFINKSQMEFHRILKDDGMLWMKWNEFRIPFNNLLPFFKEWDLMLKFYSTPAQQTSKTRTYWAMFMKVQSSEGRLSSSLKETE